MYSCAISFHKLDRNKEYKLKNYYSCMNVESIENVHDESKYTA